MVHLRFHIIPHPCTPLHPALHILMLFITGSFCNEPPDDLTMIKLEAILP